MVKLGGLIAGYRLCAKTEGKSQNTIAIVVNSVGYFEDFLRSEGLSTHVTEIGPSEIRAFILYLQQKRCFSGHRFNRPQNRGLSGQSCRRVRPASMITVAPWIGPPTISFTVDVKIISRIATLRP